MSEEQGEMVPAGEGVVSLETAVADLNKTLVFFQKQVFIPLKQLVSEMERLPMIGVDDHEEFLKREADYDESSFEEAITRQESLMTTIAEHSQQFALQLNALEQAQEAEGTTPASVSVLQKALTMRDAIQKQVERMHALGQEVMQKSLMFMKAELAGSGEDITDDDQAMLNELEKALGELSTLIEEEEQAKIGEDEDER